MVKNWLLYLLGLAGAVVFHTYYFGWFSWFLLVLTVCLPMFSLLVSLPAMVRVRLHLDVPDFCIREEPAYVALRASNGFLPLPRCRFRLQVRTVMTGGIVTMKQQTPGHDRWYVPLDTAHCGVQTCLGEKGRVYDYLGLFWLPIRADHPVSLVVKPAAVPPEKLPNLTQFLARRRQPKPGGGFSEEHELRDYRPGDSLRDMHWKLSAKTDRLIVREAQEPIRGLTLLTLDLSGTPDDIDSTLEQLVWLSQWMLDHDTEHQVLWIDPADCQMASVTIQNRDDLEQLLDRLLHAVLRDDTPSIAQRRFPGASWRYHIQPNREVQP